MTNEDDILFVAAIEKLNHKLVWWSRLCNKSGKNCSDLLSKALSSNKPAMISFILDQGLDNNHYDPHGRIPLTKEMLSN